MNTWTPLWSGTVESSLWDETDLVVKVFLTMIALKDADHIYRGDAYKLSRQSRKSEVEVLGALKVLAEPDRKKITPQPHEGRRIQAVEDGWLILNGEKYRDKVREEMKKARNRRSQAAYRERKKAVAGGPLPGETATLKAEARGDQAHADRVAAAALPAPVMGNPTSQVPRGTSPESGEVGKKAPSAGIPAEITPEAAAKMRAYVEEQARLTKAREAAQQRPAATVARLVPAVPVVGPVGMPKPTGSPLGVGWAEQEVEIGKASIPGPVAAGAPAKPAGPVPISAAIHQPVKAAGQG